jgi:hypothetical protein
VYSLHIESRALRRKSLKTMPHRVRAWFRFLLATSLVSGRDAATTLTVVLDRCGSFLRLGLGTGGGALDRRGRNPRHICTYSIQQTYRQCSSSKIEENQKWCDMIGDTYPICSNVAIENIAQISLDHVLDMLEMNA